MAAHTSALYYTSPHMTHHTYNNNNNHTTNNNTGTKQAEHDCHLIVDL